MVSLRRASIQEFSALDTSHQAPSSECLDFQEPIKSYSDPFAPRKQRRKLQNALLKQVKLAKKRGDTETAMHIKKRLELESQERCTYNDITQLLKTTLSEEDISRIAHDTGFCIRERKTKPLAIIAVFMMGCMEDSVDSLKIMCSFLKKWFKISLTPQSLQEKMNREQSKIFFQQIMERIIKYKYTKISTSVLSEKHKFDYVFKRILLQDSTVVSLPENMWRLFPGSGGSASKSAIKIDIIFDLIHNCIIKVNFVAGKVNDNKLSKNMLYVLDGNDLVIRDLGYFNLYCLKEISKNNYFISRLSINTYTYLNKDSIEPVDLTEYFKNLDVQDEMDMPIYIGKNERFLVRLLLIKVPPEVEEARRQQYKRSNGRSKEPSESLKEWNGFTFMITNITKDQLSLQSVIKLYKIRWQIELFFKNCKSNLSIDKITGSNRYRLMSLIYVKVTIIWIITILYAYAQSLATEDQEISLHQFTIWLQRVGGLKEAFATGDLSYLLQEIANNIEFICKQRKRKQTTTWKDIEDTYTIDKELKEYKKIS